MVFPVIGGDGKPTGYEIDNSMRFNRGDAACLRKTFSGSPTSTKICTISFWTKLADPSNTDAKAIFSAIKSGSNEDVIKFMGVNNSILNSIEINFNNTNAGTMMISSGNDTLIKFRDPSAWYHLVIAIDSSQGTASNRVKAYINGTQHDVEARVEGGSITDDVVLTQDYELGFLTASAHSIGENVESAGNEPYDGYLADFHFVDGSQLAPTAFAETDDNGVWIPKDCKGDLTYGNYGFFLEFQQTGTSANASGKGADTSGNDNHFDDANATAEDITTDTPTNNFCTWNPLDGTDLSDLTFSEGNTKVVNATGVCRGTLAAASGKWYWEIKQITAVDANNPIQYGIADTEDSPPTHSSLNNALIAYSDNDSNTEIKKFAAGTASDVAMNGFTSISQNDIIQFAFDADTAKLWIGKNGTYLNSGDPANGTGEVASTNAGNFFTACLEHAGVTYTIESNFGNPSFAISSGNADANGYGNFEYAVPSGFYSLCTKNLAEYG
jgi:hypothetical protein